MRKRSNSDSHGTSPESEDEYVHIDINQEVEPRAVFNPGSDYAKNLPRNDNFKRLSNRDADEYNPMSNDIQKYISTRRYTFAVALNPQDVERMAVRDEEAINIPEISRRSPTPPPGDQRKLSYKEQFLPCPVVLQVRPTYDRRASDGSASIQSSIAQFHALRKARKAFNQASTHEDSSGSSNQSSMEQLLSVPICKEEDSGSDQEPDPEEVARYLRGRGRQQRHTLGCAIDPTAGLAEAGIPESFCSYPQRRTVPTRDRERASPVPYSANVLGSADARLRYNRRSSEGNTGSVLKGSIAQERPHPIKDLQAEFMMLQQQCGSKFEQQSSRQRRVKSQKQQPIRKRDQHVRHSYPRYHDVGLTYEESMAPHEDVAESQAPAEEPRPDHFAQKHDIYRMIRMQEEEMNRLKHEQVLQHKLLLKRQEEEQREVIRRASGGNANLEASIESFLKQKGLAADKKGPANDIDVAAVPPAFQQQPEQLQEQMQRLNLRIPEMAFVPGCTVVTTQVSLHSTYGPVQTSVSSSSQTGPPVTHVRHNSAPANVPIYSDQPPTKDMEVDVSRLDSGNAVETNTFPVPHPDLSHPSLLFPFANIGIHPLFANTSGSQPTSPIGRERNGSLTALSTGLELPGTNSQPMYSPRLQHIPDQNEASFDTEASNYWTSLLLYGKANCGNNEYSTGASYINNNSDPNIPAKEVSHPLRSAISYDMISEKEINFIVTQIQQALDERQSHGIGYNQSDAYFSLFGNGVQMEIEVSNVPGSDLNGIKLRRVDGDTWVYKKLCNELLSVIKV